MNELHTKTALITGGGSGVGACIALTLAKAGVKVCIVGRTQTSLKTVAAQHAGIDWSPGDVVNPGTLQGVVEKHGPFDIVVANAGTAISKPFARMDMADLQSQLNSNTVGVFNSWQAGLADMQKNGWGRLVAIASTAGLKGYPYVSGYCASKHAVIGLTRALSLELARTNITVNAICPGFVQTPMLEQSIQNIVDKTARSRSEAEITLKANNPQRRFIQPEEIAQAVLWLCGPQSDSITGQALSISGGEI